MARDTPIFLSDVKARHDKMVELVERMMTADGLRFTAYGPDEDDIRIVEDTPKAKTPHEAEALQRQIAATDRQIGQLTYELYGLTEADLRPIIRPIGKQLAE